VNAVGHPSVECLMSKPTLTEVESALAFIQEREKSQRWPMNTQEILDHAAMLGWIRPEDLQAGTDVTVTRDDGSLWHTRTRTEPWQLGDGTWVVALEGRAGGYRLDRVRRREGAG